MAECPGDEPAPIEAAPTLENEFLSVRARVWRSGPACSNPTTVSRPLVVHFFYPATWTVVTAGDPLTVEVVSPPDVACGAVSGGCQLDCQCGTGEVCLSGSGFGGPYSACERPCEFDRECGGQSACVSATDSIEYICMDGLAECDGSRPCPDGFTCAAQTCSPDFVLGSETRHACACDSECDPGLRCVFAYGATTGRCDAVCRTTSDAWCQGPHTCGAGSVELGSDGVCAWVGE